MVAQANEPLTDEGYFVHNKVTGRFREEIIEVDKNEVHLMDVSPKQMVSVATALIPFLENDDANRALMGSNMQRQAVPLLVTDSPIVGTGMEHKAAKDSGICVVAKNSGIVERLSAKEIIIKKEDGSRDKYKLTKFQRSNQSTCLNQRPIVELGDHVEAGDIIADGASTSQGELALGKNPLIGFMTWEGYNYEDAVLLSERLVQEDVYTSVHIEEFEAESRDTKLGPEEITRDIPNVGEDAISMTLMKEELFVSVLKLDQMIFLLVKLHLKVKQSLQQKKDFFVQFSVKKQEKLEIHHFVCHMVQQVL